MGRTRNPMISLFEADLDNELHATALDVFRQGHAQDS